MPGGNTRWRHTRAPDLDPWREQDACGVGFVARASGERSHAVTLLALEALPIWREHALEAHTRTRPGPVARAGRMRRRLRRARVGRALTRGDAPRARGAADLEGTRAGGTHAHPTWTRGASRTHAASASSRARRESAHTR